VRATGCPSCSQNAHDQNVLVRCAQLRAALATPLTRGRKDWKALARATGTSRCARGWAGEKVARWKINQPPSLKRKRASLEESSVCSFYVRSRTNTGARPERMEESRTKGGAGWSFSCSRNAHDQNVHVQRTHSKATLATSPPREVEKEHPLLDERIQG